MNEKDIVKRGKGENKGPCFRCLNHIPQPCVRDGDDIIFPFGRRYVNGYRHCIECGYCYIWEVEEEVKKEGEK